MRCVAVSTISLSKTSQLDELFTLGKTTALLIPILRKLDRAMINDAWNTAYPTSMAIFNPPGSSDHSPCAIQLALPAPSANKPFRFFRHVATHPNYVLLLAEAWSTPGLFGTTQFKLSKKWLRPRIVSSFLIKDFSATYNNVSLTLLLPGNRSKLSFF